MITANPVLRPLQLDKIERFGWPWHGKIRGGRPWEPGLLQVQSQAWVAAACGNALAILFDMGLPDPETSGEISDLGGAWWGRALVRYGLDSGFPTLYYGQGLRIYGLPLWVPAPGGEQPRPFFCHPGLVSNDGEYFLRLTRYERSGGHVSSINTDLPLSVAAIGQTGGAAVVMGPGGTEMGEAARYTSRVLDVRQNQVLLGIVGEPDVGTVTRPGGSSQNSGEGVSGWHRQLLGLALVTITSTTEATWQLLEGRAEALGNPAHDEFDDETGSESSGVYAREYERTIAYTSALAAAYFDDAGEVVTIRYNRYATSTMDYQKSGSDDQCESVLTTRIELLAGATVVDEYVLEKRVEWTNSAAGFEYAVTFTRNDEAPRVVNYTRATRHSMNPVSPLSAGMPVDGDQQMLVSMLGQTLLIGGVNVLPGQGYYQSWISRMDGRSVCICSSYEDTPYAPGAPSVIAADAGPAVYPGGVDDQRITRTFTVPLPSGGRDYGFINYGANPFACGSYNPATGQLARNENLYVTWA